MMDDLKRQCDCCGGLGYYVLTLRLLPRTEQELLRALWDGQQRQAGELPNPGSTQRMAMRRLTEKGLVKAEVVERHMSRRNHRFGYTITRLGSLLLEAA